MRELKASSQRVGIRHAEEIGVALRAANEAAFTSPVMQYVQAAIMTGPVAIAEQAPLDELKSVYLLIARSTKPQLADKNILQRSTQAIQRTVALYHPVLVIQQLVPAPT